MLRLIIFVTDLLFSIIRLSFRKGSSDLVAENLMLRQQLLIMKRNQKRTPKMEGEDWVILGLMGRFLSKCRFSKLAIILSPAVILRVHKALVEKKYSKLFGKGNRSAGRNGPSKEIIDFVLEIKRRNKFFGCPRIAMLVSKKLGIELTEHIVRRILKKHYIPPQPNSPSWLTFLGHSIDSLWSVDFFKVESIFLKTYWVMVVMDQWSRRIIGFAVKKGEPTQTSTCQMFNKIIQGNGLPQKLSTDHDKVFQFGQWEANLRVLDIKPVKTPTDTPTGHPFIERVIGTTRREFLDKILFVNKRDLENKLEEYRQYYNIHRPHYSLDGFTPCEKSLEALPDLLNLGKYGWQRHCGGLFQVPIAA